MADTVVRKPRGVKQPRYPKARRRRLEEKSDLDAARVVIERRTVEGTVSWDAIKTEHGLYLSRRCPYQLRFCRARSEIRSVVMCAWTDRVAMAPRALSAALTAP